MNDDLTTANDPRAEPGLDADATPRLQKFIGAMLPISIAYEAVFAGMALAIDSRALLGGAAAIVPYVGALLVARRDLAAGKVPRAALVTGAGLLVMIAIGAVFVQFQLPALILIGVAAIVVVMPHVERTTVLQFAAVALVVLIEVVVVAGLLPPVLPQPPAWFRDLVLVSSVLAAAVLVVLMLTADHERMRALVVASKRSAKAARIARDATEAFLLAAAHQLRTPISTVLLQAETMLQKAGDGPDARRLERLVRQAKRLRHVVDEMLDVSRAGTGLLQLDRQPLDVSALIRDVAQMHAHDAQDARVELLIDVPEQLTVHGDADRLALVASNLLDNAIKYGAGKPARVMLREDATGIVLTVSDGGAGIAPEDRERCFERATRAPSAADGGLGVGLWLVRELSHAMGGRVEARAGTDAGATFVVHLPRGEA